MTEQEQIDKITKNLLKSIELLERLTAGVLKVVQHVADLKSRVIEIETRMGLNS